LQVGDRVCILGLTTPSTLEVLLAATAAGAIAAPLNTRWTPSEVAHALATLGATVLVTDRAHTATALQAAALASNSGLSTVLLLDPVPESVLHSHPLPPGVQLVAAAAALSTHAHSTQPSRFAPLLVEALHHAPNDAACIIFTSGTTGPAKAAILSHTALHFQCAAKLDVCGYSPADVYLHTAPLYHVGGLCSGLAMLAAGARSHVFMPSFSAEGAVRAMERYGVTNFIAVPTMVADLVAVADTTLPGTHTCLSLGYNSQPQANTSSTA
jgi:o-succinylbenzoate---CoA ligase